MATIAGHGTVQDWDLATGEIHPMLGTTAAVDTVTVPLSLGPYEAKVIVVGPLAKGVAAAPEASFTSGDTLMALDGDWKLDLNGKQMTTGLKSWEDLGAARFAGPATYTMQFTAATAAPKGKRVYLEIADVHDCAKVTLNGKDVGAKAWQPYRWDVTDALKKGANDLKIEAYALQEGGRGGAGGAPPAAGAAPAAAAAPALATLPAGTGAPGAAGMGGGRGGRGGRGGAAAAGAPGAPGAGAPPAGMGGGGRGAAPAAPPTSGLLGSVKLVVY
jgi:hypothetical protein